MKVPTKFVNPLTDEQREQLKEIMKSQAPQRKRMRAHAILLSDRGYSIDQIADIYPVDRDRVSAWMGGTVTILMDSTMIPAVVVLPS